MLEVRATGGAAVLDDQESYEELSVLEEIYASTPYPSRTVMEQVAAELQISIHKVRCWFNNRRAKTARDNLARASKRATGKHSLKRPPTAQQRGPLNLHVTKARPNQPPKASSNYTPSTAAFDRRLSLPAHLGGTIGISGDVLKPQRYQAHDDLEQLRSKSNQKAESEDLDPLLHAISREANMLLTRVTDRPGSTFNTSQCLALLKALLEKAETFVAHGLTKGTCILVTLSRSFAYGIANLDNSYSERTQFSVLLTERLLKAILRTDLSIMPATRRSNLQQIIVFYCKRVSQYDNIPLLQALPSIFLNPWPSKLLIEIMKGTRQNESLKQSHREMFEIAQARLDVLLESSRYTEAVHLAKWYFDGGVVLHVNSCSDFLVTYVNTLLKACCFDEAVDALIDNRERWQGEKVADWVQHLVDAGSPRHAEILLQTLSSSCRKMKY